jgi:hypothetical protein
MMYGGNSRLVFDNRVEVNKTIRGVHIGHPLLFLLVMKIGLMALLMQ